MHARPEATEVSRHSSEDRKNRLRLVATVALSDRKALGQVAYFFGRAFPESSSLKRP